MSPENRERVRKRALTIYKNPLAWTPADVQLLARAVLMLTDGRLPK